MMLKIYDEEHVFQPPVKQYQTKTVLLDTDTFGAAINYNNSCCLNFASHKRPGGGYRAVFDIPAPIKTQEEDLFRRSNLPWLMDVAPVKQHYPLTGLKGIYCDSIKVTKNQCLAPLKPFTTSLITVAAVVNPQEEHKELVENKVRRILNIASEYQHDGLVLGAWGCGAFCNEPLTIATLFKKMLEDEFEGVFKEVVFAIPGKTTKNYKMFESVI